MKNILYSVLSLLLVFSVQNSFAQGPPSNATDTLLYESFDSVITKWSMVSTSPNSNPADNWWQDTQLTKNLSPGSATDTISPNPPSPSSVETVSYLTTPNMLDTFPNVTISFDHIGYIGAFNAGAIQVSFNNGPWKRIPVDSIYEGLPIRYNRNGARDVFTKLSYAPIWGSVFDTSFVFPRQNNDGDWRSESFDITTMLAARNIPSGNKNDSIKFRLELRNTRTSPPRRQGNHQWWVDNFLVTGANCGESTAPLIELDDPPQNYPKEYEGIIYLEGPYFFDARITDNASSIKAAMVEYYVEYFDVPAQMWVRKTGGPNNDDLDTVPMVFQGANRFSGQFDKIGNKFDIEIGDRVGWRVIAIDGSFCENVANFPDAGYLEFQVRRNRPPTCTTQPVFNFPYYQTFDSQEYSNIANDENPNLPGVWLNTGGDFHEWYVGRDTNTTRGTGPTSSFPEGGNYMFVESADSKIDGTPTYQDSTAFLVSPCFDLYEPSVQNSLVRFYLNLNTAGIEDTVFVDIFDQTPILPNFPEGTYKRNIIPPVAGNKGDNWLPFEFSTYNYRNSITQIRFVGKAGRNDGLGNLALDSFKIIPAALEDMRLNAINLGPYNAAGIQDTIKLNVQNLGVNPVSSLGLTYEIYSVKNGVNTLIGAPVTQTWSEATLLPGADTVISLNDIPELYTVPLGRYFVRAWLDYANDLVLANDTAVTFSNGLFYASTNNYTPNFKYYDKFDKDTLFLIADNSAQFENKWEVGTPDYDNTYSAFSEPNAWDILLDDPYTGTGRTATLITPFFDLSQANNNNLMLSFMNARDILEKRDGVFLEYSLDKGLTWDSMPSTQDPAKKRWYNSTLSEGGLGGTPVFAGTTHTYPGHWDGYVESELVLPSFLAGNQYVLFRFSFFAADLDGGNDGMSIDNFVIYEPYPIDVEPLIMLSPTDRCELTDEEKIQFVIKNRGLNSVSSIDVKYRVTYLPTNTVQEGTQVVNRTIPSRDTIYVAATPKFDMFLEGDYKVEIITQLTGDGCIKNDTLTNFVERVDGCTMIFTLETDKPERVLFAPAGTNTQSSPDSTVWRFDYTSGGESFSISKSYLEEYQQVGGGMSLLRPNEIYTEEICMKNDAQVEFNLNDRDTLIKRYSMVAFNGNNDTVFRQQVEGGPDSPTYYFDWQCPPQRSASATSIIFDRGLTQLPVAKNYLIEVVIRNSGLDSLDNVDLTLEVDGNRIVRPNIQLVPPLINSFTGLRYTESFRYTDTELDSIYLAPGRHFLRAWTSLPNRQDDLKFSDDTVSTFFSVIDTFPDVNPPVAAELFCEDFEDEVNGRFWIALEADSFYQNVGSFEQGIPNQTNINASNGPNNVWMTGLDENYPNLDQTSLISPFVELDNDSCYELSFNHNYYILDDKNDGGTFQYGFNEGRSIRWVKDSITFRKIGVYDPDSSTSFAENQVNWFNRRTINGMPDNNKNSGWSGNSNGWVQSTYKAFSIENDGFYLFRWRFSADNSIRGEGWAIDDFCITATDNLKCFTVGLDEENFDIDKMALGQNIPNPTSNSTQINYYLPKSGQVRFMVTNMMGQVMFEENVAKPKGNSVWELNTSSYADGIYYYTVDYEGERLTKKMLITK